MNHQTCEQRIASNLVLRREEVRKALKNEDRLKEIRASVLSIEFHDRNEQAKTVRILLSWGGPADWWELDYNKHGLLAGRYSFQDWEDFATRKISFGDAQNVHNVFLAGDKTDYNASQAWNIGKFPFKT